MALWTIRLILIIQKLLDGIAKNQNETK
jgi:hypothetical protein